MAKLVARWQTFGREQFEYLCDVCHENTRFYYTRRNGDIICTSCRKMAEQEKAKARMAEHDKKIKEQTLDEFRKKINKYLNESTDFADFVVTDTAIDYVLDEMKGGAENE